MLSFLKDHPFAVEAFFKSSVVLTFAVPKEELKYLIPECLELDLFKDQWAFIAVAMVQTKYLRPKGFPKIMGNDFFLIGYRIFVRYANVLGKRLRGLYILKSETDKKKMEFFGNILTHYNYTTAPLVQHFNGNFIRVQSAGTNFNVEVETSEEEISLPEGSPFVDWKEARRYAGPLPFTFTYQPLKKEVLIIEGVREDWVPKPLKVIDCKIPFLDSLHLSEARLANAFIIANIPYYWKKGKREQWKK